MPLAPTVLGLNSWLLWQVVPLFLSRNPTPRWMGLLLPMPALLLFLALRFRHGVLAQVLLLVFFPLLLAIPELLGVTGAEPVNPVLVMPIKLTVYVGYLVSTCNQLAKEAHVKASQRLALCSWKIQPKTALPPSEKWRRRTLTHQLLLGLSVALPCLFLYAICLHPQHVHHFVRLLGSPARASGWQATLLSAAAMLWSSLFYFTVMRPIKRHIGHDLELRRSVTELRQDAMRARLRPQLYVATAMALGGLLALLFLLP